MAAMVSCPLCCEKTFPTKASLIEHLSKFEESLKCSICNTFFTSFSLLLKHLREDLCSALNAYMSNNASNSSQTALQTDVSNSTSENNTKTIEDNISSPTHIMSEFDEDTKQIYVELLKRPLLQDLEDSKTLLPNEGGQQVNGCVVTSINGVPVLNVNIVTKQNCDGTILLTSDNVIKEEVQQCGGDAADELQATFEPARGTTETQKDAETNECPAEIYSCNTCGVTFTSVIDHIKTYHQDQDVILENTNQSNGVETEKSEKENKAKTEDTPTKSDTLRTTSRRYITVDEGCIIENPEISNKTIVVNGNDTHKRKAEEVVVDKKGRKFTRCYVPVGKNIKQSKELIRESLLKNNLTKSQAIQKRFPKKTYHQVIVKNMMTLDGSSTVQVYFCLSCNTYVSELKEFQEHPCKDSKDNPFPTDLENVEELLGSQVEVKDCTLTQVVALKESASSPPRNDTLEVTSLLKKRYKTELEEPDFKCDICSTVFPSNKSLKLHRRMHDPHKIKPIEPPVELQVDGSTVVDSTYLCTVCNKMIPSSYKHIHTMSHVVQESFHCDICNKKFTSSDYLNMHMKAHNTGKVNTKTIDKSLPYSCLYCTRQFARPHEKVKHERIHTGEKPHSCEICGKTFRVAYCLTLHMRTHTGARPYACQHCGKRFKAHSVYNHHLLTHSDVRAYKCPYCPKAFKNSVQLAGHKNSHTKPFSCKDCNRPFASLYAVRCHTETHKRHNNLKFNCTLCGASYARSFALNDHMKQAHKDHKPAEPLIDSDNLEYATITWDGANEILLKTDIPSPASATENFYEIANADVEEVLP